MDELGWTTDNGTWVLDLYSDMTTSTWQPRRHHAGNCVFMEKYETINRPLFPHCFGAAESHPKYRIKLRQIAIVPTSFCFIWALSQVLRPLNDISLDQGQPERPNTYFTVRKC